MPANSPTAREGNWIKAPGFELLKHIEVALGRLPLIAEDLGMITPEVLELRDRFGAPVEALPVWGGTGANVVSLACSTRASDAVICSDGAHIHVDEAGAPERMTGAKVIALPAEDGKLRPEQLAGPAAWLGDEHHPQPRVLSITQSTEYGTLYEADEVRALCDAAHALAVCHLTQAGTTGTYAPGQGLTIRRTFQFDLVRQGRGWVIAGLRE